MKTLAVPPPLTDQIHMDCVTRYTTQQRDSLRRSLFASVTNNGHFEVTPCNLAGLYVMAAMLQEEFRRFAPKFGLTGADLDVAVKHAWPEFLLQLEHEESGAISRADRSQN